MERREKAPKSKKSKQLEVSVLEVVNYMRIQGLFQEALADVVGRKIAVAAAKKAGFEVTPKALQKAVDAFRAGHALHKAKDTHDWLAARGLSQDDLEEFVETNLLIAAFMDQLEKKVDKKKYVNSAEVRVALRSLIYRDWVSKQLQ